LKRSHPQERFWFVRGAINQFNERADGFAFAFGGDESSDEGVGKLQELCKVTDTEDFGRRAEREAR
jgi:hypothetical protein